MLRGEIAQQTDCNETRARLGRRPVLRGSQRGRKPQHKKEKLTTGLHENTLRGKRRRARAASQPALIPVHVQGIRIFHVVSSQPLVMSPHHHITAPFAAVPRLWRFQTQLPSQLQTERASNDQIDLLRRQQLIIRRRTM